MSPRQPDGTIYLTVGGDWTQPAAGALRSLFDRVRRHRPTLVIADLSDVTVMDSTALDALIEAHRSLAATGCRFERTTFHPTSGGSSRTPDSAERCQSPTPHQPGAHGLPRRPRPAAAQPRSRT